MIKLVIFDVDGVILDTESLFIDSCLELSNKYGYDVPRQALVDTLGGKQENDKKVIMSYMPSDFDYDTYEKQFSELKKEKIKQGVKIKKGFFELVNYLKKENIKMTFATSTIEDVQKPILKKNEVFDLFENPTYGSDVKEGKPSPEIYLKAFNKFNFKKEECLIIEDSTNGILSAINAGIKVLYCEDQAKVSQEVLKGTYGQIEDLSKAIPIIEAIKKL